MWLIKDEQTSLTQQGINKTITLKKFKIISTLTNQKIVSIDQ